MVDNLLIALQPVFLQKFALPATTITAIPP